MPGDLGKRRIEIATRLFLEGWSGGDPDAPEQFWAPDGVLEDVASGTFRGWPAIREFFAGGLTRTRAYVGSVIGGCEMPFGGAVCWVRFSTFPCFTSCGCEYGCFASRGSF